MKNTNKYYVYDVNHLNDKIKDYISLNTKKLVLNKKKYSKIIEKHTKVIGSIKLLEKIKDNLPELINEGYQQNGMWLNNNGNDYVFLTEHLFDKNHKSPICIPLHYNEKNQYLSIKTFYIVKNIEKKKHKFNKKYDSLIENSNNY